MRWWNWLTGRAPPTERERLIAEKRWGQTPETLRYYNELLDGCSFEQTNRRTLREVLGLFQTGNIEDLIALLQDASQAIEKNDYLPELTRNIWFGREGLSLDEYLRSRNGGFISIFRASRHLHQAVSILTEAFEKAEERKSEYYTYYRRALIPLIREVLDVQKHLLAASDTPPADLNESID